jgi:hypothetical protein
MIARRYMNKNKIEINQIRKWDRKWEFNKTLYNEYFIIVDKLVINNQKAIIIRSLDYDGIVQKYSQAMIEDCSYEVEEINDTNKSDKTMD